MDVTFVSASFATSGSFSRNLTCNKPAGVAVDDFLVAFMVAAANSTITYTTPTGWTRAHTSAFGNSFSAVAFYKKLDGSEGSSFAFNTNVDINGVVLMPAYRGARLVEVTQIRDGVNSSASTSLVAPSVTTLGANRRLVCGFCCASQIVGAISPPSGFSERAEASAEVANTEAFAETADAVQVAQGVSGTKTATSDWSTQSVGFTLALAPWEETLIESVGLLAQQ